MIYIVVGRDPRDVLISMRHHAENMAVDRLRELVIGTVGEEYFKSIPRVELPDDPHERWRCEVDLERGDNHTEPHPAWVLHHLATGWERRALPNVGLFHFADLKRDLPAEMARLAGILGIEVSGAGLERLAAQAGLDQMRARAKHTTPASEQAVWRDPARFFRRGGSREWRDLVTPEDAAHYEQRVAELVDPELAAWAHHGWSSSDR